MNHPQLREHYAHDPASLTLLDEFVEYFASLGVENFQAWEFLVACQKPGNHLPPRCLWGNIAPTACLLDRVRRAFGRPTHITSCFRAPLYNQLIGGEPLSEHQAFMAVDFWVEGSTPEQVGAYLVDAMEHDYQCRWPVGLPRLPVWLGHQRPAVGAVPARRDQAVLIPYRELIPVVSWNPDWPREFVIRGGVGVYPERWFVHLDTRGYVVVWIEPGSSTGG